MAESLDVAVATMGLATKSGRRALSIQNSAEALAASACHWGRRRRRKRRRRMTWLSSSRAQPSSRAGPTPAGGWPLGLERQLVLSTISFDGALRDVTVCMVNKAPRTKLIYWETHGKETYWLARLN